MRDVSALILRILPDLVALRHEIHRHPELGYEEHGTARRILAQIEGLEGLQLRTGVAGTGLVATLGADRPGPCVALRADMDALPIQEQGDHEYRSLVPGKMHACGHDGHVSCLVGAARVLSELRDDLAGPVKFIFQPAEEGAGGGLRMCQEGVLDDPPVAAIFGLHGWPGLEQGQVGVRPGPFLASSDRFQIVVAGKGAHAAFPHQGVDPILIAAHIVVALQSIAARNTDPLDSAVVTVAQIQGGTAFNIIPPEVELAGTVRALRSRTRQETLERIERIAAHTAQALGGLAQATFYEGTPTLENDPAAADYVGRVAAAVDGIRPVEIEPVMGGEDFAFYSQRVASAFFAIGVRPPGRDSYPQLHQPDYDFADAALATGVAMHVELARRFWSEGPGAA